MFKKIAIAVGVVLLLGALGIGAFVMSKSNARPEVTSGAQAEALADKMLASIDDSAWRETGAVSWDFPRGHKHLWDRERNLARVQWGEHDVLVDLSTREGIAKTNGSALSGPEADAVIEKAWALWANDSFWLNPVSKIRDGGTTRGYAKLEDGREALMVTYASGGVTPGDSYLYIVGEDGLPTHIRMWVKIIPIDGVEFTFEGWHDAGTGAKFAPTHEGLISVNLEKIKAAPNLTALVGEEDPFAPLVTR